MTEGKLSVRRKRDWWFGLLLPLPLFVQMNGPFGFYAEPEGLPVGIGVPIGFLLAAAFLLPDLPKLRRRLALGLVAKIALLIFGLWTLLLGFLGAQENKQALLYAGQWLAPLAAAVYVGVAAFEEERLSSLLAGLKRGTTFSLCFLVLLFLWELLFLGSFSGRITQNVSLPGMYQLYNYVPVSLTLSALFCAGLEASSAKTVRTGKVWFFLFGAAMIPLITGARDPALIFMLVAPLPAWWACRVRGLLALIAGSGISVCLFLILADGNLLLLHKLHGTFSSYGETTLSGMFGPRAEVMESYWGLAQEHPWTGLRLLPPTIADPESGVVAKSAHNTYLDILAGGGPIALLSFLTLLLSALWATPKLVLRSLCNQASVSAEKNTLQVAAQSAAAPVVGLLLISCNLRTPLREPISAWIGFLLIGFLLSWAYFEKRPSSSSSRMTG
ncbi:MAG: O-antigen ligase family protein [Planctomycetota bacterium]|nr:O-antigen ligase family protein [Planctomycetota bacterium]MDA1113154.1 O-antigen ligase family protein [Planctomycetota bacterium]